MQSVTQIFDQALKYHQGGNLHEAEVRYRQVLQIDPRHVGALNLLGLLAHQVGRSDLAVETIGQALRLHPAHAPGHSNLAMALRNLGRHDEAIAHYHEALRLQPDFPAACNNLAIALQDQGKLDEAIAWFQRAVRQKPDFAEAYSNLANAQQRRGQLDEAIANCQQAVRLKPEFVQAYNNLGNALRSKGRFDKAITTYRQALRVKPDYAEVYSNLANVLIDQGKFDEAIANCQQAVRLKPDFAEAYCNLGNALRIQGKLNEAITNYWQALRLKPDYAEAYGNLGNALREQGKLDDAVASYQKALSLKPDHAETYCNLGNALKDQKKLDEASTSYQRALSLKPDFAEAHNNLGIVLQDQGKIEEAIAHYQQAVRLKPDFAMAHTNLGNALNDHGKLEEAITSYRQALRLQPDCITAHDNLVMIMHYHPAYDSAVLLQEARGWNNQHAEPLARYRQPHANAVDPDRRLRIGYVSPDFRNHAGSPFMVALLSNHDHQQVEIFCYAEVACPDAITEQLRAHADAWRSTVGLTDEQVAGVVRQDRIDILVDLALHTSRNRLLVLARKPAPVQATWLGYPGTTGMSAIDYRLTDPYFDPPGENDCWYAEQSIRLPNTFACYDPMGVQVPVQDLPALANGFVTFGCLNNFCKINDVALLLWARMLRAVPGSHLLLLAPMGYARDHVLAILRQEGIEEPRVEFADRGSRLQYLETYNRIDVGLDPMPCNGYTTTLDAMWMGVPTVTLIGRTVVGRAGWSLLCNLGLQELAARTPEDYVALAVNLVGDLPRLRELRQTLRARMAGSPLMDGPLFAHRSARIFRQMWYRWCQVPGPAADPVGGVP